MNCEIPDGLSDLLRDFTISVLRERPGDLYNYAAEYFMQLKENQMPKTIPMYIVCSSDDEDAGEPDIQPINPRTRYARRQSVSAERYDPEEDSDDEDKKTIHPKTDIQRMQLNEAIKNILLFRSLDPENLNDVIDAMFERIAEPGDKIIEQGDDGDNFYVIQSGLYDVFVKNSEGADTKVFTFDNSGSFGELALMYNMPRTATVVSTEDGTLWAMDRDSFRRIVLKSAFKKRRMYEQLLESVPILSALSSYERMNLADAFQPQRYGDGDVIIREGEEADGMYFIEDGNVRVTITKKGEEHTVSHSSESLTKGGYFGEMALVEDSPRTATVYAVGDIKVAYLDRASFERLLGPCIDIMKRNMQHYEKSE